MSFEAFSGKTVLVLDDDKSIRDIYGEVVECGGGHAVLTGTIDEALKVLAASPAPDLFITDWNLNPDARPEGPHTDPAVRMALSLEPQVPTIMISATDDSREVLGNLIRQFTDAPFMYRRKDPSTSIFDLFDGFPPNSVRAE